MPCQICLMDLEVKDLTFNQPKWNKQTDGRTDRPTDRQTDRCHTHRWKTQYCNITFPGLISKILDWFGTGADPILAISLWNKNTSLGFHYYYQIIYHAHTIFERERERERRRGERKRVNLLIWHWSPVYPCAHWQVYRLIPSMQKPPFWHGWDWHSLISVVMKGSVNSFKNLFNLFILWLYAIFTNVLFVLYFILCVYLYDCEFLMCAGPHWKSTHVEWVTLLKYCE